MRIFVLLSVLCALLALSRGAVFEVTTLAGDTSVGSLRWAATQVSLPANNGEPNEIVFAAGLSGEIVLDAQMTYFNGLGLTITGPGVDVLTVRCPALNCFVSNGALPFLTVIGLHIIAPLGMGVSGQTVTVRQCIVETGAPATSTFAIRGHNGVEVEDTVVRNIGGQERGVYCPSSVAHCNIRRSAIIGYPTGVEFQSNTGVVGLMTDSTVTGSSSYGVYVSNSASMTMSRSTIAHNTGSYAVRGGTITMDNSIIYNPDVATGEYHTSLTIVDNGHNIFRTSPTTLHATSQVADPQLLPLADIGGSWGFALAPGSPALDAGDGTGEQWDQRGEPFVRVYGAAMDIGAYEEQPVNGGGAGDPVFTGFFGQYFFFGGHIDWIYHLFSDAVASMNALFVTAKSAPRTDGYEGTVMGAVGIVLAGGNHSLECSVASLAKDVHELTVLVDGQPMLLVPNRHGRATVRRIPLSGGCAVRLAWAYPHLDVVLPSASRDVARTVRISWRSESNAHINTSYLNVDIASPLPDHPKELGGIIGMTADRSLELSTRSVNAMHDRFVASALLATDAPSSVYRGEHSRCGGKSRTPSRKLVRASAN